jgi:hypothetical protein
MNEQEQLTLDEARKYFDGFPEAPYSDSFKWVDANGFEHLSTVRSWTGGTLLSGIEKATAAITSKGGKPVSNRGTSAPAPTPDPAAMIALEEGNKTLAAELQQQAAAVPAAPSGKQWNITEIVFVRILPQPGDKVTVEFYGNDRKQPHNNYADLMVNKWDADKVAGLMKHVTSADVTKPAELALTCHVYWLEGKEKSNGGHFKDVYHVR